MRHRSSILAAGALVLAACSTDKATGVGVSGTVSFTYTGGGGGSYNATGTIVSAASATTARSTTWATGWKVSANASTNVAANVARSNLFDFASITIARQSTGSSAVDPNCTPSTTTACTDVILLVGADGTGKTDFFCQLTAGSVTIASMSASNVQGSFSGSGTCTQGVSPFATSTWVVSNGSFNVPIVPVPPAGT